MRIRYSEVDIVTDGSGDGTGYASVGIAGGRVLAIRYVRHASTPYTNGVGLAVTVDETGQEVLLMASGGALLDLSITKLPRRQVHDGADGAVMTVDGSRKAVDKVPVGAGHRVKLVVNAGGAAKSGKFWVLFG